MKRETAIRGAAQVLAGIQLDPRNYPRKGFVSTAQSIKISVSLPDWIVEQVDNMGDARSHHIEKALKLYLETLQA
jgi:hypothetical protein